MNFEKKTKIIPQVRKFLMPLAIMLVLAVLAFPGLVIGQSYVEPEGPPPQSVPNRTPGVGNDPAINFLNGSTAQQQKLGSLLIGERNAQIANCTNADTSGCPKLCLNGDPADWTNDPAACIAAWSDLASLAGGSFVRLLQPTELSELDRGFATVRGFPERFQLLSLISQANTSVASGAVGIEARSTSTSHYAAEFFGTLLVKPESGLSELCLNTSGCIVDWADLGPSPVSDGLLLQSAQYVSRQPGNVGLNGPLLVGSLIAGQPTISTSTDYTCGDGLCSAQNLENQINCPADCL